MSTIDQPSDNRENLLSLSQKFSIKTFRLELEKASREQLIEIALELVAQKYGYQNMTKQLLKGELLPDDYLQPFRDIKDS